MKKKFLLILFVGVFYLIRPQQAIQMMSYCSYPIFWIYGKIRYFFMHTKNYYQSKDEIFELLKRVQEKYALLEAYTISLEQICINLPPYIVEEIKTYQKTVLPAKILQHRNEPYEQKIIINKGTRNGVEKNMIVVHKNFLLGKVEEVYPWYSVVMLITDRKSKVAVHVNNIKGICEGLNDTKKMQISFVEEHASCDIGTIFISSGEGLLYPEGFGVGAVVGFSKTTGLYMNFEIEPLFDVAQLETCYILIDKPSVSNSVEDLCGFFDLRRQYKELLTDINMLRNTKSLLNSEIESLKKNKLCDMPLMNTKVSKYYDIPLPPLTEE